VVLLCNTLTYIHVRTGLYRETLLEGSGISRRLMHHGKGLAATYQQNAASHGSR
jgi:hypothetical protein